MKDYLELGTVPCDEDCVQVTNDVPYEKEMKEQCQRYIELLRKKFPTMPESCAFVIKRNPHDFGCYYEVAIKFNDEIEESTDFAFFVESNLPLTWDDENVVSSSS